DQGVCADHPLQGHDAHLQVGLHAAESDSHDRRVKECQEEHATQRGERPSLKQHRGWWISAKDPWWLQRHDDPVDPVLHIGGADPCKASNWQKLASPTSHRPPTVTAVPVWFVNAGWPPTVIEY